MSDEPTRHLEQELADERAQRSVLERRLAAEVEKVKLWRTRAEDRAVRIERLEKGGPISRFARAVRTTAPRGDREIATTPSGDTGAVPVLPVVRVGAAVHSTSIRPALEAMSMVSIEDPETDLVHVLAETDLVVIEPDAFRRLPEPARDRVEDWVNTRGRPPLVIWEAGAGPSPPPWMLEGAAVALTTDPERVETLRQAWRREVGVLGPTFDPSIHNPRRDVDHPASDYGVSPGRRVPGVEELRAAARGVSPPRGDDLRPGVASRRWAYRLHAPWVRAAELLELSGVSAPDPVPTVAGLLVSRRTDRVEKAIESFLVQTQVAKELVVALHGIEVDLGPIVERAPVPVSVVSLPSERPLGACLNDAASLTGAPVLAKIDDDDHYGPGHLEDAVHALRYTDAGIVGKSAMFVYLEEQDRTVLRRAGDEEKMVPGTMPGGSLVMHRRVWDAVRFPHRPRFVDALLLQGARRVGEKAYANSRWEFCLVRGGSGHTYRTEAQTFLAGAEDMWEGFHPDRVEVTMPPPGQG